MRRILVLAALLLCALPTFAQNMRVDDIAFKGTNPTQFAPGATITVCTSAGSGLPCTPKVSGLCSSATDAVCNQPDPTTADSVGNFGFWIQPGTYVVTITGSGLSGYSKTWTLSCPVSGSCTFTGTVSVGTMDGQFYVDGQQFSGCPAATTAATTYASGTTITIPGTGPIVNCAATVPENIIIRNFDRTRDWCNGAGGAATPPCNAVNFNYDDGNVYAAERHEMTTLHQNLNGATLGLYTITHLKNATANGNSGIDGFSAEANTEGTLSGTFRGASANEMDANIGSTGGTITEVNGGLGYVNSLAGNTTAITTANGYHGVGCNTAPGAKPTNCYGGNFEEQTLATSRNYALRWVGRAIGVWGSSQTSGFDLEESNHTTHPTFFGTGASPNTLLNLQALTAAGFSLNTADGVPRLTMDSIGRLFATQSLNATGTGVTLGGSGSFSALSLGTANNANSFTFTPAATSQATTVSVLDPKAATAAVSWQGGIPCTNGELALSAGWGTTATVTAVVGLGWSCEWTVTSSGTGQAANPTITDTLVLPVLSASIACEMRMVGGTGTSTLIDQTTLSATAPVFTFGGTPVAASTYKVYRRC